MRELKYYAIGVPWNLAFVILAHSTLALMVECPLSGVKGHPVTHAMAFERARNVRIVEEIASY